MRISIKFLLIGCFTVLSSTTLFAQSNKSQQVNLAIGDTLYAGKCATGKSFTYIDMYTKTRISDTTSYNKETGEGFSEHFFGSGDLDGKRMPCNFSGKPLVIVSYKRVRNKKTGVEQTIILAWLNQQKMTIAMIEIEAAWEAGEVTQ